VTEEKTVFAEVLAELMCDRGIDPTPEALRQLAERSGLDWAAFEARLASSRVDHPGKLGPLANELALDKNERDRLACAFAFERRLEALL
jgi:hypothetical protein